MRTTWAWITLLCTLLLVPASHANDTIKRIQKAVEQCTLDQHGTPPFHLKATLAPSYERDKDSGRTGEVEIWWKSPDQWRREVRSPEFHQVQIVDGPRTWQKNEGDYFPEWLRETAEAIVRPVPLSKEVLDQMRGAEERHLMGGTYLSWAIASSNGQVQKTMGAGISIRDDSGLLFTANGFGWNGEFKDYSKFHNRMVARAVGVGSPEVKAKVVAIEELGAVPDGWFDAGAPGGDAQPIRTVLLDESTARKNLVAGETLTWPTLKDGPLDGVLTTEMSIDRTGKVREIGTIVSDNPGVSGAAREQIAAMRFTPFLQNGEPVQVFSRITVGFRTTRPVGAETFDTARNYFERGRILGFPAAGAGSPYVFKAGFQARSSAGGNAATGQYEDTWISANEWRREATFGSSRVVRSRNGATLYQLEEGPDAKLLLMLFQFVEPIPALDTFVESDWRIKSDMVGDAKTVRVVSGYESPEGKLDPQHARGYWFDANGNLVKSFFSDLETRRSDFEDFGKVHVARRIDVFHGSGPVMHIQITGITAAGPMEKSTFELKGHEITRQFTSEAR